MREVAEPSVVAAFASEVSTWSTCVMYPTRVVWSAALSVSAEMFMLETETPFVWLSRIPVLPFASKSLIVESSMSIVPTITLLPERENEATMPLVTL